MTITRPVIVKVRVTEAYKKALAAEAQDAINRLDAQLKHLNFQMRRVAEEKKNPGESYQALSDAEMRKLLDSRQRLTERLKEIGRLANGQEVVHGRVESLADIKVGDQWERLMAVEVVLEDGYVVEIRQGGIISKQQ